MAFTPISAVYLLDTPLDNNNKNQLYFETVTDQFNYFISKVVKTFEYVTYQRKDNKIRVNEEIDNLWNCNYVMYQNGNFANKWFYAFITKMEYVNANATDIFIETDVFQSWLFDVTIKPSFVVREHVADDTIGKNLVDEQLDLGEYKMNTYQKVNKLGDLWNVIALSDLTPLNDTDPPGNIYANVVSGLCYFCFPTTHDSMTWLKNVIKTYDELGKPEAIVMIFTLPRLLIPDDFQQPHKIESQILAGSTDFSLAKELTNIDGYTPKNKKLFSYPYKFLYASNNTGQSAQYRYEDFNDPAAPDTMTFKLWGGIQPNPTVMMAPLHYKGAEIIGYEYGLTLQGFPMASWSNDTYTAWLAQNSAQIGVATVGALGAVAAGAVTGNVLMAAGGIAAIFGQIAQLSKAQAQPDQARGQTGSGTLHIASNTLDFFVSHMSIKADYAKRIDDFFSMFGYKVNALKVPELHSRQYWNFIQTIDINIVGSVPDEDMNKFKKIFNEGVTLWHNAANFLNYDLDNVII